MHYFDNVEKIVIQHLPEFDERQVNAVYRDNVFYLTNKQSNAKDFIDDIVHEFAHHIETMYPKLIYGDEKLINEFRKKRHELNFELRSEGYWTNEYDSFALLHSLMSLCHRTHQLAVISNLYILDDRLHHDFHDGLLHPLTRSETFLFSEVPHTHILFESLLLTGA